MKKNIIIIRLDFICDIKTLNVELVLRREKVEFVYAEAANKNGSVLSRHKRLYKVAVRFKTKKVLYVCMHVTRLREVI